MELLDHASRECVHLSWCKVSAAARVSRLLNALLLLLVVVTCSRSNIKQGVSMYMDALNWIRTTYPYWNATKGANHIWLFAHDEGACWAPAEIYNNSIILSHWGRMSPAEVIGDAGGAVMTTSSTSRWVQGLRPWLLPGCMQVLSHALAQACCLCLCMNFSLHYIVSSKQLLPAQWMHLVSPSQVTWQLGVGGQLRILLQ